MPRDYKLYLRDVVEAAQFIETHTAGLSYEDFAADDVRLRAVLHSLNPLARDRWSTRHHRPRLFLRKFAYHLEHRRRRDHQPARAGYHTARESGRIMSQRKN